MDLLRASKSMFYLNWSPSSPSHTSFSSFYLYKAWAVILHAEGGIPGRYCFRNSETSGLHCTCTWIQAHFSIYCSFVPVLKNSIGSVWLSRGEKNFIGDLLHLQCTWIQAHSSSSATEWYRSAGANKGVLGYVEGSEVARMAGACPGLNGVFTLCYLGS